VYQALPPGQPQSRASLPPGRLGPPGVRLTRLTWSVDLEQTLARIVKLSREELSVVRKRGEEKTPAREHGHDFHEMESAADRLDHLAHTLRHVHDQEFGSGWRQESRSDSGG
jgi:hypothetical protein